MSDITADDLARYDSSGVTAEHWKIMFISGMGFFTDAYDLFIIGVAMRLIKGEWHPPTVAVGLVTSTALLAAAVGAVLFGRVADMLGRKHASTATRCWSWRQARLPPRSHPASGG